jgi:23S rRNA (adenine2030-N6)-methyltransferase
MLAYRHAFHAGNHADVLKHLCLVAVLRYLLQKDKGLRVVDTHAGAGGYLLHSEQAAKHREHAGGIGALWPPAADAPPALADYLALVGEFNGGPGSAAAAVVTYYPGSPALAHRLLRPQDQLRLYELHPSDHRTLASAFGKQAGVEVHPADGFAALKGLLPPPTRRALLLIDPPYEIKSDYARTLAALREALTRFADATVLVWSPQLQLLEAQQLPQRLRAAAQGLAPKGWLHARLTVGRSAEAGAAGRGRGLGLVGSHMVVANPPHTLAAALRACLPLLQAQLGVDNTAGWAVETSV